MIITIQFRGEFAGNVYFPSHLLSDTDFLVDKISGLCVGMPELIFPY